MDFKDITEYNRKIMTDFRTTKALTFSLIKYRRKANFVSDQTTKILMRFYKKNINVCRYK